MDKNQRDYFLREQMRAISNELDEDEDDAAGSRQLQAADRKTRAAG